MTTSLPSDAALFHMTAKVFKRSEGRSSVAAAAYRSASRLHDSRIGQDFDYRSKPLVTSFIMAPTAAPDWTLDREALWNRVEEAELRKDAQVAREVEISIPRDIPEEQWEAFARAISQHYVEAGAIVDVAIHCPADAYGEPQPHIHAMIALRALDATMETGFSKTRNARLAEVFESGGFRGGKRGEALTQERARVAAVMNLFLAAAGSARRASHESYVDRGIDREPEIKLGEERMHAVKDRKRHDRKSALVSSMRNAKTIENLKTKIEEELMRTNPKFQIPGRSGLKPRHKQDYKAQLLDERFPGIGGIDPEHLHMIDVRNPAMSKIHTRDGGWVEIQGNKIRRYGKPGYAEHVATSLADYVGADDIQFLAEEQSIQKTGSGLRQRRAGNDPVPQLSMPQVETCADKWRSRGYHDLTEAPDGCWLKIGSCRIQDLGDELRIHGKCNDAAGRALLQKAIDEWGSEVEIFGSKDFKDAIWLEAQRSGVHVYDKDTGKLYEPSPELKARFDADRAKASADVLDLEDVKAAKTIAALLKESASGDVAALAKLELNDPSLTDFITIHLDDEQRAKLAGKPESDILDALPAFREYGRKAREADDVRGGGTSAAPRPTTAPPEFQGQDNESLDMQANIAKAMASSKNDEYADDGDDIDYFAEAKKEAAREAGNEHERKPS